MHVWKKNHVMHCGTWCSNMFYVQGHVESHKHIPAACSNICVATAHSTQHGQRGYGLVLYRTYCQAAQPFLMPDGIMHYNAF